MYKYFSLLIATVVLFSCTNEPIQKPKAKLSGNIEGLSNKTLLLVNETQTDTIKLDSLGHFNLEKDYSTPTISKLYFGRKGILLYLTNSSDLSLTTTKNDFGKVVEFKGEGSKENQLLNDKDKLAIELKYVPAIFKLNPEQFMAKSDSVKQLFLELGNKYSKDGNIDSSFIELYNADVKYEQLLYYTIYTPYHKYFTKEEASLPESAKKEIEAATVDKSEFAMSDKYIQFMTTVLKQKYTDKFPETEESNSNDLPKYLKWINSELKSNDIKNAIFYNAIKSEITYCSETERDSIYATFSELNTNPVYQETIDKTYASFEKLRKGKPAAQWSYPDINGKKHALSDFKGKFVYIDVWATWCGPCKAEIPELAKLAKEYKNKNIEFVSVSVDSDQKAWERMLKKENFDWTQLHAEKAWKSKIVLENEIRGIPRFMLIDREGNVIDINALRPSSKEIRPLFDKLLSQK